LFLTLNRWEIL